MEKDSIRNKIDESGLITLDVSDLISMENRADLDLADWLEEGVIIRESVFKKKMDRFNWSVFEGCFVSISCSIEAIIPPWVYLLIQIKLRNIAKQVFFCSRQIHK